MHVGPSACRCRGPGSAGMRQGALMRQWRLIHLVPLCMGHAKAGFPALTPEQGHCLVDTMALLPTCQGDPGVIGDAKLGLHGAALILPDRIISKAAHRHGKQDGGHGMADPKIFASFLSGLLKSRDIRFRLVRVEQGMYASVLQMLYDRAHPRLSEADCTLLSAAVGCPDMDVMTSDKALVDAINSERGPKAKGRILDAMSSHHGRRQSTAKLIRNRLGSYIPKGVRVRVARPIPPHGVSDRGRNGLHRSRRERESTGRSSAIGGEIGQENSKDPVRTRSRGTGAFFPARDPMGSREAPEGDQCGKRAGARRARVRRPCRRAGRGDKEAP